MLEVSIEAALLNAETPEHVRLIRRRGARIRRRWRERELVDLGYRDLGGESG
jgi:hypothetical protein